MSGEDRELLVLAAMAGEIEVELWFDLVEDFYSPWSGCGAFSLKEGGYWNPLEDDGDAFRLAVKLDLLAGPEFWHERSVQYAMDAFSGDRQNPYAATRRAIVRAAAEIGRKMI